MYICLCKNITDTQIKQAVLDGSSNLYDVRKTLGVATQCCKCLPDTKAIIDEALERQSFNNSKPNPLDALSSVLFFPAEVSHQPTS